MGSTSTCAPARLARDQLLVHRVSSLTGVDVGVGECELPTFYWLPRLRKRPCRSRFMSNSGHCSTAILSGHIASALTAVRGRVVKYSETAFGDGNVNYFWSIGGSSGVVEGLRLRGFRGSQVSSFDFSALYTSLPHGLVGAEVLSLVNWCFNRGSRACLCASDGAGFFGDRRCGSYGCWSCAELCEAFAFLVEGMCMQFDGMVCRQVVGIPVGASCAPLVADLFLYCCERDFVSDLRGSKRFDLIDVFNDASRCLGGIFAIGGPGFEKHLLDVYPAELQLNGANASDKEASFLDLGVEVVDSDIHAGVCDKRDDFGFPIVGFPWLGGGVPGLPSCGVCISRLLGFARCCAGVLDFHSGSLQIASKLLT